MKIKIIFILTIYIFFFFNIAHSIENQILIKIKNEIITSIDVQHESEYLIALNPSLNNLEKKEVFKIAKNSLINDKIKEFELLKYKKNFEIDEKIFEKIVLLNYSKIGIDDKEKFLQFIKIRNIDFNKIKKKLIIEAFWNELIYNKFNSKIKIDKNALRQQINENEKKSKSYLLYEILFNVNDTLEIKNKFKQIETSILERGFDNTAMLYSVSETAKSGGKIGWMDENSINPEIKNKILGLKKNEYTQPILTPGGFIILKLEDIKETAQKIDLEKELDKIITIKANEQLKQFSNLYFNKVKKDIIIYE